MLFNKRCLHVKLTYLYLVYELLACLCTVSELLLSVTVYFKYVYKIYTLRNNISTTISQKFPPFSKTLWLIKMTYHFSRNGFLKQILWWMTSHCFPIQCVPCMIHKALPLRQKNKNNKNANANASTQQTVRSIIPI